MAKHIRAALAAVMLLFCVFSLPAFADDWVAMKLRGIVLQLVDGEWTRLSRGDVVPDDRVIRTMPSGHVQFQRDQETIDLGPSTQVQIIDKTGKRYTTVRQHYGSVSIEAEVQNVRHFSVETPYLAAVVKGTRFVVVSGQSGASVKVTRGHVEVEDIKTHQTVTIAAGQSASTGARGGLDVSGRGKLPEVHGADGAPVAPGQTSNSGGSSGLGVSLDTPVGGVSVGASGGSVSVNTPVADVSVGLSDGVSVDASVGGASVSVNVGGSGGGSGGGGGVVSNVVGTVGHLVGGLL